MMTKRNGVAIQVCTLLKLPLHLPMVTHAIEEHDNRKDFIRNVREEEVEWREIGLDTEDTKEQEQSEVNKCNANYKPYDAYKLVHSILYLSNNSLVREKGGILMSFAYLCLFQKRIDLT